VLNKFELFIFMKKKIAIYTESFPPKSGGVAVAQYNLYHLLKNLYDIKIFVYSEDNDSFDNEVIKRKAPRSLFFFLRFFVLAYLRFRVKKQSSFASTLNIFKTGLRIKRLNKELHRFNPDYIIMPDHFLPIYNIQKTSNCKLFWAAHHNYSRFTNNPLLQTDWADLYVCQNMEYKAFKKADGLICPSNYMQGIANNTLKPTFKSHVIYNFLSTDLLSSIEPRFIYEEVNLQVNYPIIYLPSAGTIVKGKKYIFEIIRRIGAQMNNKVVFYLSGPIPSDLKYELNTIQGAFIFAPGNISWEHNLGIVKTCSIGVTPNLVENFSYAILEAHFLGLPFVAFDTGGNNEIIEDNSSGFIVPYLGIEQLIEKTMFLLNNLDKRDAFGKNAESRCKRLFSKEVILDQYAALFK